MNKKYRVCLAEVTCQGRGGAAWMEFREETEEGFTPKLLMCYINYRL